MTHRGVRSEKSIQRRVARRLILDHSFHDKHQDETISLIELPYSVKTVEEKHPFRELVVFRLAEVGEVLKDNRARGSFQKMIK